MRTCHIVGLLIVLLLLGPLGVGLYQAPCDLWGAPVVLTPYRLRQQRFLARADRWLTEVAAVGATLERLAQEPPPATTAAAFRLAEQVGQAAGRLETLTLPEAPPEYALLTATLLRVQETYAAAAEQLLLYYGHRDPQAWGAAQATLQHGALALREAQEGLAGLSYPRCREVWRDRG
jgi:hypothetical protein